MLPQIFLAILFTDLIGLISIKHYGLNFEAKKHAGPDPIDLPLRNILFSFTPILSLKKQNAFSASFYINSLFLISASYNYI